MSLKAGRVGVAPDQVDVFGKIKSDATSGYTKQEADAKFQPMRLEVPIKYLNGSVLGTFNTVQDALSGSYGPEGAMTNSELTDLLVVQESAVTDIVSGAIVASDYGNHLIKIGKVVQLVIRLTAVSAEQWTTVICKIPEGYRPKYRTAFRDVNSNKYLYCTPSGNIQSGVSDFSNTELVICTSWITS